MRWAEATITEGAVCRSDHHRGRWVEARVCAPASSSSQSSFLLPTSYFLRPTSYFLLRTRIELITSSFLLPTSYFLRPTSYPAAGTLTDADASAMLAEHDGRGSMRQRFLSHGETQGEASRQ